MGDSRPLIAPPNDLVTRLFCAACYLRESFADLVTRDLVRPSQLALSPLWQVDALRVARHAQRARRQRRARDLQLFATFCGLMIAGTLVLAAFLTDQLTIGRSVEIWVVLWLWVLVVGIDIVFTQYLWARRSALGAAFDPDPNALDPEPLKPSSVEEALIDLNSMNAVLFEAESTPFVGSGVELDRWIMTLDVGRAVTGARLGVRPFTGADLQDHLLSTVPETINPMPTAGNRLYVRGGSTAPVVELFRVGPTVPDLAEAVRFRRPVSRVSDQVIRHYLEEPSEAARVYTVFQHSGWGGQSVVTVFVRAFVSNRTLFVEVSVCALRPLRRLFYAVRGLSVRPPVELLSVARSACADALPMLLTSPSRVWRRARRRRAQLLMVRNVERQIQGKRDVDFGATSSLREEAASDDLGDHFASMDEQMHYQIFNRRVLECIGEFLQSRGVDMTEFRIQQNLIMMRTTTLARSLTGAVNIPAQGGPSGSETPGSGGSGGAP